MADLILAKLALWGTDIDTFELAASRSEGDGSLSAMLIPHSDPSLQILLTHEQSYPVRLVAYSTVPPEMLADPRLDQILLFLEETRPANLSVCRQGEEELEVSLWIYEEAFDRQSLNLAVSEMSLVRRILSRRLQGLTLTQDEPGLVSESPEEIQAEPNPEVFQPVEAEAAEAPFDPNTSSGGRARRGPSLPPPAPLTEEKRTPPAPPEPAPAPAFDPFASAAGSKKGPATVFPGAKESMKVPPTVLPGLARSETAAPSAPEGKPLFDPFSSTSGANRFGPATVMPGVKQPMKVIPTVLPGLGAKKDDSTADTKNCPNCNGELRAKARFCTWCGHRY